MYFNRQYKNGGSEVINVTSGYEDILTGNEKVSYRVNFYSFAKYMLIILICFFTASSSFALEYPKGIYKGNTDPHNIDFDRNIAFYGGTETSFKIEKNDEYSFFMTMISATNGKTTKNLVNMQIRYEVIPADQDSIGVMRYIDPETLKMVQGGFGPHVFIRQRESEIVSIVPSIQNLQLGMSRLDVRNTTEENDWEYKQGEYSKDNKKMQVQFNSVGLLSRVEFEQFFSVIDCDEVWGVLQKKYGDAATTNVGSHGNRSSVWKYEYGQDEVSEVHASCLRYSMQTNGTVKIDVRTPNAINDSSGSAILDRGSKLLSEIIEKRNQKTRKLKSEKLDI